MPVRRAHAVISTLLRTMSQLSGREVCRFDLDGGQLRGARGDAAVSPFGATPAKEVHAVQDGG
jgi:hypothetical protein